MRCAAKPVGRGFAGPGERADANFTGDWTELADAPSMWPVEGRVASSFGEREDPINGEGAFHTGVDIDAPYGTPVRAAGDGDVTGRKWALDTGAR
jgi:murein DD-endopeptidase MepM/ murein hydrolase activator NlpD